MSTDFLFAKQSFIRGVSSLGNLSGDVIVNDSVDENEADTKAIAMDWRMIGNDIKKAIDSYGG